MAKLNLPQASKAVGIARGTLYTHIKQGKVSVETNKKGEGDRYGGVGSSVWGVER